MLARLALLGLLADASAVAYRALHPAQVDFNQVLQPEILKGTGLQWLLDEEGKRGDLSAIKEDDKFWDEAADAVVAAELEMHKAMNIADGAFYSQLSLGSKCVSPGGPARRHPRPVLWRARGRRPRLRVGARAAACRPPSTRSRARAPPRCRPPSPGTACEVLRRPPSRRSSSRRPAPL